MSRKTKRFRRMLLVPFEWFGIGILLCIIPWMSRGLLYALCDFLSALMYFFDRRGKRRALENLHIIRRRCVGDEGTHAFDPDSAAYAPTSAESRIIRRAYRNMARSVGYAFWTICRARSRCSATGELDAAARAFFATNHPVIAVSGHLGCWEILSQLVFLAGHPLIAVAKGIGTRGMTALLMRARRSIGLEIVLSDGALKPLMTGIRAGKTPGLLVDQKVSPRDGGVWIRFFGRPMPVSAAPAFLAAKAKVPIFVGWSRPLRDGRYRCETAEVITAAEARDIWATTQRIATDLECVIRRHPSCWVLTYNPFRKEPSAEALAQLDARTKGMG